MPKCFFSLLPARCKFSFHCEKDCLRSPDCEKTGQLATRKRYASERACFRPSTAQIPVKIYRSNAKSYSTNDSIDLDQTLLQAVLQCGQVLSNRLFEASQAALVNQLVLVLPLIE